MNYELLFTENKIADISGRYITLNHFEPYLKNWDNGGQQQIIGFSVLGKPIYSFQIGHGAIRILLWSQMHGNETTTTKAIADLLNLLHADSNSYASKHSKHTGQQLRDHFTFYIIPMLNPDGAELYTRENAANIDLNRDAQLLTQPDSRALRNSYNDFKPDYCYNMHDQRTIYGAGSGFQATVSFLAPAYNEALEMNSLRERSINLIVQMNKVLQQYIPQQVGRFDDSFNINCVGDTFQFLNTPTILFEAGHFPNDYQREETRKYIFIALLAGFKALGENVVVCNGIDDYLNIPQNKINFYDIVYKNVKINYDGNEIITNFAVQFNERLSRDEILFEGYIAEVGNGQQYSGHLEYEAEGAAFFNGKHAPELDQSANFQLGKIMFDNGKIRS